MHAHDHDHPPELNRRDFLRLAGASVALAGLDGCSRMPAEHILPYVDSRPELTPGIGSYYATAMSVDGYATGLIVESHEGRPTKIEGNPAHPASLGAAGPIELASVLQLYDPDRGKSARVGSEQVQWERVAANLAPAALRSRVGGRGSGLHLLIEPTSSLLDEELLASVLTAHPDARIYMYSPMLGDRATDAAVQQYDIANADVIVAIDSDFLSTGPFHLRYARQFADNRRLARPTDAMNRLYVVESTFSSTGSAADHRFAVRPREVTTVLRWLLTSVINGDAKTEAPAWIAAIARDLRAHQGRSLVIVGDAQPASIRALGDAINNAIGASGKTTWYTTSPLVGHHVQVHKLADLVGAMDASEVDTLIVIGGNPSYATPRALGFSSLMRAVPNSGYLGLYENETARDARWFVPMSHYLERWGDARAYDGTVSIVQPLVNPLYRSIAPPELYATLAGTSNGGARSYDLLRASWTRRTSGDAETAWSDALQRGVTADAPMSRVAAPTTFPSDTTPFEGTAFEVIYLADPKIHDGSFANNGWLQELPAPLTQLTWGNAGLISPATAHRLNVSDGDIIKLSSGQRALELPALVVPGHADDTVSVHFGYGRTGSESAARDVGADAYALWPAVGARSEAITVTRTGAAQALALAQTQSTGAGRDPVHRATLDAYRASPSSVGQRSGRVLSLYPEAKPPDSNTALQWAMTIDLTTCIGCGACVVGCQSENNIPVIGASEVRNGRSMQWMHVERYFADNGADAAMQPMLCQHCENAPCEYVCPVGATVHSSDGLNEMVYNRCVGTRFCSNNCPYKVRHFNWFDYNKHLSETELMVKNPNVTVRERGVMEKCTFCVQRIREAEIAAGRDGRAPRGTDVQTACQQACPTNAIVFGSLTEPSSEMMRRRDQPRSFAALAELGTEPRVRYLARIRNANPEIHDSR